jgi:glycyl-tRNA synthetase beta chain
MTTKNLLVELFVEELPPKVLSKLGAAFAEGIRKGLQERDFLSNESIATAFASPRRLAVHVTSVREVSAPREIPAQALMPASVGLDAAGKPTVPLIKKLRQRYNDDVPIEWLMQERVVLVEESGKKVLKHKAELAAGGSLLVGLEGALEESVHALPIPKVMQYQLADGWTSVNFVRPAHGLVALYGDDVIPVQTLGLTAGRSTHGHRFEALVDPIVLKNADEYAQRLESDGAVIASFAARRDEVARQLQAAAAKQGLTPIHDDALLDEVTALVERPNVLTCQFEPAFLDVPQECLILTMKANQKYFPLLDAAGKLTNQFLVVSNIRPADASRVIEGNERVVRPRLADAKFFFDQDRKHALESRVAGLDKVVYHGKLGTQGERVLRVRAIAMGIANTAFPHENIGDQADRAAMLAKADLLTDMVGEFPELQGVMGGYYAANDGETAEIAQAVEDHYKPRFAGDALPRGNVGLIVALADKLETLVGLFGIGQLPTGDKDPFALRRHALGVIRMLNERSIPIDLHRLIALALPPFGPLINDPTAPLLDFIYERLAGNLREQGYSAQEVDAVLSLRPPRLAEVGAKLAAVRAFAALPEAASLAAANKRVGNILKKVEGALAARIDERLLSEPAETALNNALNDAKPRADTAFDQGDYAASLQALAALKIPVDEFFDTVMVNAEDPALRANRLGLLATLHAAMNRVADLSKLAT